MALAEADKMCGELRQKTAGVEAKSATIGEAGSLNNALANCARRCSAAWDRQQVHRTPSPNLHNCRPAAAKSWLTD
jgi:hypothetical protein